MEEFKIEGMSTSGLQCSSKRKAKIFDKDLARELKTFSNIIENHQLQLVWKNKKLKKKLTESKVLTTALENENFSENFK